MASQIDLLTTGTNQQGYEYNFNGVTLNTKTSPVQITASTARAYSSLILQVGWNNGSDTAAFFVDIMTGAASSEVAIVENVFVTGDNTLQYQTFMLPIAVAAGTRLSMRWQVNESRTGAIRMRLYGVHDDTVIPTGITLISLLGANTSTTLPPKATGHASVAWTKGGYVELAASTADDICAVIMNSARVGSTAAGTNYNCDLAVGAAASEVVKISDVRMGTGWNAPLPGHPVFFPLTIAQGSRVAVNLAASSTTADLRDLYIGVLACYGTISSSGGGLTGGLLR